MPRTRRAAGAEDRGDDGGAAYCCFGCRFASALARPAIDSTVDDPAFGPPSTLLLRLGIGIFLALNIMVASWLSYAHDLFGAGAQARDADAVLAGLFRYGALFLCTVVVALLGVPLLVDAARPLRQRRAITTSLLIVIGVFSAYAISVVHTLRGAGSLYFDTAAVVLVVVTLGSHLEPIGRAHLGSSGTRRPAHAPPATKIGALIELRRNRSTGPNPRRGITPHG